MIDVLVQVIFGGKMLLSFRTICNAIPHAANILVLWCESVELGRDCELLVFVLKKLSALESRYGHSIARVGASLRV